MDEGIRASNIMQQRIDRIRFYHFISGVLKNQGNDSLCSRCTPFVNTIRAMKEGLEELNGNKPDSLPPEIMKLIERAETAINSIELPEDTEGQKKAGNCKLPKGVCFVKSSKALIKEI